MTSFSLKLTLSTAVDDLLSLNSTVEHHAAALSEIERLIADLALDPSPAKLDAFLHSQDSLGRNLVATLLEWLGRILARQQVGQMEVEEPWENLVRALRLFQGLLLLHRPSQRLFARRCSLEYLLAVLDMTRSSHPFSPALSSPKPFPSPVIFPSSPFASPSLSDKGARESSKPSPTAATQLAIAALDTLLCALVDRPTNMRVFEEIGGLDSIVKILKDKAVAQVVRIKVIELLYYYLMPEGVPTASAPSPNSSFSTNSTISTLDSNSFPADFPHLLANAADFIPQTPVKARPRTSAPSTPSRYSPRQSSSTSSRESSPSRSARRSGHSRSQSLADLATPATPSSHRLSSSLQPPHPMIRTPSSVAKPLARSRPSSSRPFSTREPTISESDTDTDASASASSAGEERTPRASRLSGLLSSAASALGASTPASAARRGHRRTQSASTASTPSSSRERPLASSSRERALPPPLLSTDRERPPPPPALDRRGLPSVPLDTQETPRRRSRASKGSSDAEEMPPPPVPLTASSSRSSFSSSSSSSSRPVSHTRSRSLVSVPSSPRSQPLPPSSPRSDRTPLPPPSPRSSSSRLLPPPSSPSSRAQRRAVAPAAASGRARHVRTEEEKKDLLRRVMPNVDALEERFKAMGLGPLG